MRYLRKVKGKTRRDRVRNTTMGVSLKTVALKYQIKKARFRWFGNIQRMERNRLPKQLYEARISMRTPRGNNYMKQEYL